MEAMREVAAGSNQTVDVWREHLRVIDRRDSAIHPVVRDQEEEVRLGGSTGKGQGGSRLRCGDRGRGYAQKCSSIHKTSHASRQRQVGSLHLAGLLASNKATATPVFHGQFGI